MIPRTNRFHGHGSLDVAYRHGRTVRSQFMALKYSRNDRRKSARVAVVVSKKVSKSAVVRNRIRRRVFELVRTMLAPNQPCDLIFSIYNVQVAQLPVMQLREQVASLLTQAHIARRDETPADQRAIVDDKEK